MVAAVMILRFSAALGSRLGALRGRIPDLVPRPSRIRLQSIVTEVFLPTKLAFCRMPSELACGDVRPLRAWNTSGRSGGVF